MVCNSCGRVFGPCLNPFECESVRLVIAEKRIKDTHEKHNSRSLQQVCEDNSFKIALNNAWKQAYDHVNGIAYYAHKRANRETSKYKYKKKKWIEKWVREQEEKTFRKQDGIPNLTIEDIDECIQSCNLSVALEPTLEPIPTPIDTVQCVMPKAVRPKKFLGTPYKHTTRSRTQKEELCLGVGESKCNVCKKLKVRGVKHRCFL